MDWDIAKVILQLLGSVALPVCVYLISAYFGIRNELAKIKEDHLKSLAQVQHDLAEFKLKVAEEYVTNHTLTKAIENLNKSLDGFTRSLEMTDAKLDRLIERERK